MLPTGFIPVEAMMGENSCLSPNHGTTGASPVGTTFVISTKIYEMPEFYQSSLVRLWLIRTTIRIMIRISPFHLLCDRVEQVEEILNQLFPL